jgi:hypothetical protein
MRFGNRTPIAIVDDDYYDATVPPRSSYESTAGQPDDAHVDGEAESTAPTPPRTTRRQRLASRQQSPAISAAATSSAPAARGVMRRCSRASTPHVPAVLVLIAVIILGLHSWDRKTHRPPQAGSIPNEAATIRNPAARAAQRPRTSPPRRRPHPPAQRSSHARQHFRRPILAPAPPSLPRPSPPNRSPSSHYPAPAGPPASSTEVEFGMGGY